MKKIQGLSRTGIKSRTFPECGNPVERIGSCYIFFVRKNQVQKGGGGKIVPQYRTLTKRIGAKFSSMINLTRQGA